MPFFLPVCKAYNNLVVIDTGIIVVDAKVENHRRFARGRFYFPQVNILVVKMAMFLLNDAALSCVVAISSGTALLKFY